MKSRYSFPTAAFIIALFLTPPCSAASPAGSSPESTGYPELKASITASFGGKSPVSWGETVAGVKTRIKNGEKTIALTMDACGSPKGMKFDKALIDYLEKEKI